MSRTGQKQNLDLVTVVICVYNAGEFLRPSVVSALDQTYRNLEVLIVDDGSTDGCLSTIADLEDQRIRILHQENQGKSAALNYAISELRGEFYAVQDADDLSCPNRIEKQLQCMREHPNIAAVFCGYELLLNGRHVAPTSAPKDSVQCRQDIEEMRMPAHDPTAMYRVSMVRDLRYDEQLRLYEGLDYILRVGERHPVWVLGECLYSYRIHQETLTKKDPRLRQEMLHHAMRKTFRRRGMSLDESTLPRVSDPDQITNRERDNDMVAHFVQSTVDLRRKGDWAGATKVALACLGLHPADPYYYKPLAFSLAPLQLIDWYRQRKAILRAGMRSER